MGDDTANLRMMVERCHLLGIDSTLSTSLPQALFVRGLGRCSSRRCFCRNTDFVHAVPPLHKMRAHFYSQRITAMFTFSPKWHLAQINRRNASRPSPPLLAPPHTYLKITIQLIAAVRRLTQ